MCTCITGDADDPDGLVFTNSHGLVLDRAGRPRAPGPRDMPQVAPYDGPTGERLHKDCVTFSPTRTSTGPPPSRQPAA